MKRWQIVVFLGVALWGASPAEAQPDRPLVRQYYDGGIVSNQTICPVSGLTEYVLQTFTGFFADPNEPYPKTGDLGYVHAVGGNVSTCVNDTIGFYFNLP